MASAPYVALRVRFSHPPNYVLHSHRIRRLVFQISKTSDFSLFAKLMFSNPDVQRFNISARKTTMRDEISSRIPGRLILKQLIEAKATVYVHGPKELLTKLPTLVKQRSTVTDRGTSFSVQSVQLLYQPPKVTQPYNVAVIPEQPIIPNPAKLNAPAIVLNDKYYIKVGDLTRVSYIPACYEGQQHDNALKTLDGYDIANVPFPAPGCQNFLKYIEAVMKLYSGELKPIHATTTARRQHRGQKRPHRRSRW